jgi:hypothetical protein
MRNGLLVILGVLVGCYVVLTTLTDDNSITHLAGHYYTASYDSGIALHWYANEKKPLGSPLLERVYDTRIGRKYLVARAGVVFYFLYPLQATSAQKANAGRLGPYSRAEVRQKLLQLTGDTVLQPVAPF